MFFFNYIKRVSQHPSKTFFSCSVCFLMSVGVASILDAPLPGTTIIIAMFFLLIATIIVWSSPVARFIFLCVGSMLFGAFRYWLALPPDLPFPKEPQEITAFIVAEPDVRTDGVRYILKSGSRKKKIYLKTNLYPRYHYGDRLELTCTLQKPEPIEEFRYDKYLARVGVYTICQNARIEKVGEGSRWSILGVLLLLKERIAEQINRLWHEPYASFMAGLLYGYRGGLGSLDDQFRTTGVSHIVAISGYNISLIAAIFSAILIRGLRIMRQKAFWIIVAGIAIFVIFVGMSASVVRAGIMGVLVLVGKQVGRSTQATMMLVTTATLMTLHNPLVLVWDAGFQLSFLATVGLIYLSPCVEKYFTSLPEHFGLKESLMSTLSAIIVTLPLILYQFGVLSVVAPVVNVLILWTIPWIMIAGFVSVVVSFVYYPLGAVLGWVGYFGMAYVTHVVRFFAALPFASLNVPLPWWGMVIMYVGLYVFYKKQTRRA